MSVDYGVVVGVPVEYREVSKEVVKYNEDTGKPYTKRVKKNVGYLKGTCIEINEELGDGLIILDSWGDCGYDFVGIRKTFYGVYSVNIKTFDVPEMERAATVYLLETYGYKGEVSVNIVMFVS